jgi:hypothetical protein
MGDWKSLFAEWAESDYSKGGFFKAALDEVAKLEAERDAALHKFALWKATDLTAQLLFDQEKQIDSLKAALREAKEAMVPLKEMVMSPRMNKAIATINAALAE